MSEKATGDGAEEAKNTLTDGDITSEREVGRRSVLRAIGATVIGAAVTALGGCVTQQPAPVVAQPMPSAGGTGITDSDPGDPAGGGRGMGTGITDSDSGPNSDPPGRGRGMGTGITDSDSGPNSDPPGRGRGARYTGLSDSDPGDPAGYGRRGYK